MGTENIPAHELTFMISPAPLVRECGSIARLTCITPHTFTSCCFRRLSGSVASRAPKSRDHASFIATSMRPNGAMPTAIAPGMLTESCTSRRVTSVVPVRERTTPVVT